MASGHRRGGSVKFHAEYSSRYLVAIKKFGLLQPITPSTYLLVPVLHVTVLRYSSYSTVYLPVPALTPYFCQDLNTFYVVPDFFKLLKGQ